VSFYLRAFGADAVTSWLEASDMPVTRWLSMNPGLTEMLIAAGVDHISGPLDAEVRLEQPPGCHTDDDSTVGADEHVSAVSSQRPGVWVPDGWGAWCRRAPVVTTQQPRTRTCKTPRAREATGLRDDDRPWVMMVVGIFTSV
jgi:hypothetical protein